MKQKINSLIWYLLILFVFVLPLSAYFSTRILVINFILSLLFGVRPFKVTEILKSSWDILLYLVVITFGLLYSSDLGLGIRTLETSFALLALSVICYRLPSLELQKVNTIFLSFVLGVISAGLICTGSAISHFLENDYNTHVFFFYDFTEVIHSHPTYLAYYIIFVITFGLYILHYDLVNLPNWLFIIVIIFCFVILLLTGGQTAFVGLLFIFSFFLLKFFMGQNNALNYRLTFTLVVTMILGMVLVSSGNSTQREQTLNDSWNRFELWRSAILANSDPVLGVGTGDYKQVLNDYYRENNQVAYAVGELNSHNQFIQIFFSNGCFGLLTVLILVLRPLYLAFKFNDQLGILMLFPFLIYGITEVFLGRYQGVAFFALLHQVLITNYFYTRKTMPVKNK